MREPGSHGSARLQTAEWRARRDLAACYRLADHFGWSDIVWNHITARIPGTDQFLINRFGLRYDEVTASNLVAVDAEGQVVDAGSYEGSTPLNVTGFVIHGAIHAARPDVACVIHTHVAAGLAVSVLEQELEPLILDALPLHGRVAYHAFEGLSVDRDEQRRLAASLGQVNAMILRNHGLLACGTSVGEAFMTMRYLERACRVQLEVLKTGRAYRVVPETLCKKVAEQYRTVAYGDYEWPALRRLVDQRYPDYTD